MRGRQVSARFKMDGRLSGVLRPFSAAGYTPTANVTIQNQAQALGEFVGVVLGFQNQTSTAITITTAKVASPAADGDTGGALTWVPVTFDGGTATKALPVASGTDPDLKTTIVESDLAIISPASALNLLMTRVYCSGNGTADNPAAGEITAYNTLNSSYWRTGFAGGAIADNAAIAWSADAGRLIVPAYIRFIYKKRTITVVGCGGSLTRGQGSTGNANGMIKQACALLNAEDSSRIYSHCILARSGATSATALTQALEAIRVIKPEILCLLNGSGNDALLDVAAFAAMNARVGMAVEAVRNTPTRLIVGTISPSSDLTTDQDNRRQAHNAETLALESAGVVRTVNYATQVEDPADRSQLLPALATDASHPNDAGYALEAVQLAAVIKSILQDQ